MVNGWEILNTDPNWNPRSDRRKRDIKMLTAFGCFLGPQRFHRMHILLIKQSSKESTLYLIDPQVGLARPDRDRVLVGEQQRGCCPCRLSSYYRYCRNHQFFGSSDCELFSMQALLLLNRYCRNHQIFGSIDCELIFYTGSAASLSCRLTKSPSFGMVSELPLT